MTSKMTNKKALTYILENVADIPDEVREKLEAMVAALDNKANSTKRKPTAKQTENAALREKILEFFSDYEGAALTCTEIGKAVPELADMNNQRISALMRALVDEGSIGKDTVKGKSVFYLNAVEDVEE